MKKILIIVISFLFGTSLFAQNTQDDFNITITPFEGIGIRNKAEGIRLTDSFSEKFKDLEYNVFRSTTDGQPTEGYVLTGNVSSATYNEPNILTLIITEKGSSQMIAIEILNINMDDIADKIPTIVKNLDYEIRRVKLASLKASPTRDAENTIVRNLKILINMVKNLDSKMVYIQTEQERIRKEQEEQERIRKEQEEQERIRKEQEEQEEQERIRKEQEEQELEPRPGSKSELIEVTFEKRNVLFITPGYFAYTPNGASGGAWNIYGSWAPLPFMFIGGDFIAYGPIGFRLMFTTGFNINFTFFETLRLRLYVLGGGGVSAGADYVGGVAGFATGIDFLLGKEFAMNFEYSYDYYSSVGFVHRFALGFGFYLD